MAAVAIVEKRMMLDAEKMEIWMTLVQGSTILAFILRLPSCSSPASISTAYIRVHFAYTAGSDMMLYHNEHHDIVQMISWHMLA
jgi:hypothetical protein